MAGCSNRIAAANVRWKGFKTTLKGKITKAQQNPANSARFLVKLLQNAFLKCVVARDTLVNFCDIFTTLYITYDEFSPQKLNFNASVCLALKALSLPERFFRDKAPIHQ